MAEVKPDAAPAAAETTEASKEDLLERIYGLVGVPTPTEAVQTDGFVDRVAIARKPLEQTVTGGLRVFIDAILDQERPVERVDKNLLDSMVAELDAKISRQLDEVLHHEKFQQLESAWRGLKYVVDHTNFRKNCRIEMLNVSKSDLLESFDDATELIQSALYKHVYTSAYDQFGEDPYSVIVSNYEFENTPQDLALLQDVSKVAASAHCPFLGSVGPKFFGKDSYEEWEKITDLGSHMNKVEYIKWNSFRDTEDARYVGLTFPRFLLRLPYGQDTVPVKAFNYAEDVKGTDHDRYLWGNASYAMAANMARAFVSDGWTVQIRGSQSGGRVADLPVHLYDVGKGTEMRIPTEVKISETLENDCANLGFIPLAIYSGEDYAVFFSANSTQRPTIYDDPAATANSRINARLPYIFLASRLAHYLKVIQRENIGTTKSKEVIQEELNKWLKGYVTETPNPSEQLIAKRPLRAAMVAVEDIESNPGYFRVKMMIQPHFQVEGMDISLSLVGKMPKAK